jgi:Membrane domain of glycerophosphoryl diester phosphodiesterase
MEGFTGLRPLAFGEILDVALKIVARHWKVMAACVVIVVLPVQIASTALVYSIDPSRYDLNSDASVTTSADDSTIGAVIVVNILALLCYMLAAAACFKAVSDGYLGREPGIGASLRFGLPRIPRLLGIYLLVSICVIIGLILIIAPGVWLGTVWSLAVPALLFERLGVFASLGRSFELVKGRFWGTLGLVVVSLLIIVVVSALIGLVIGALGAVVSGDSEVAGAFVDIVATVISNMISLPVFAAVLTVLYFDQRVRKEGFDLQLLADGLGGGDGPIAPQQQQPEPAAPPAYSGWQPPGPPTGPPAGQ